MVRISSAAVSGHDLEVNPQNVLKPEGRQKAATRMKMIEEKDIQIQSQRDLRERYPDFTYVDTHVRRIGGVTMFDEIMTKKKEVMAVGKRIPHSWWLAHRQKWAKITSPEASLVVSDAAQPVPQPLVAALMTATSPNTRLRNSGPLIGWLGTQSVPPNQKSICGIFRHSLSKYPANGHLQVVIAIMKMVSKLNLHKVHARECTGMHPHWDAALVNWLGSSARAGLKEEVWLDNHCDIAQLVLNGAHMARVKEAADVKACSRELRELCSSSQLGQRVYGPLLGRLCYDEYCRGIDELLASVDTEETIDEQVLSSCFTKAEEIARQWEFDERCSSRGHVHVNYSTVQLKVAAPDAASLARIKIMTWVKSVGVAAGSIDQLWFEASILPREDFKMKATVVASIVKPINCARKMVNEQATNVNVSTGELALKMMESQQVSLESIDPSASIEVALCRALAGGPGEEKMEQAIFAALPSTAKHPTLAEALAEIENLAETALYKFSSIAAQSLVAEVTAALKSLMRGQAPVMTSWSGSTTMMKLKNDVLPLFLTTVMADADGEDKTLRGLAAAKQQLRAARHAAKSEELDLGHIADLTAYDFLLSADESEEVQKWLKEIWVKAGQAGATMVAKSSGRVATPNEMSQPKKKRKVMGAETPEIDNVANLFV